MDALVAAVRAIQLQPKGDGAVAAAAAGDSIQPSQSPSPSSLLPLVDAINAQLESSFDVSAIVTAADKQLLLRSGDSDDAAAAHSTLTVQPASRCSCAPLAWDSLTRSHRQLSHPHLDSSATLSHCAARHFALLSDALFSYGTDSLLAADWSSPSPSVASSWLRLLKILARTRSDLESTLFAPEFVRFLVQQIAASRGRDAAALLLAGDCVRLLLNLCIINRALVHRALRVDAAASSAPAEQKSSDVDADAKANADADADGASPLRSLITALSDIRCSRADREVKFHYLRVLLFVLVDSRLAKEGVAHAELYQRLLRALLEHSEGSRIGVDLTAAPAPAASAAASGAPASSADADDEQFADAAENRKVVMSALKVLTNLSLDDSLPSVRSVLTSTAAAAAPAAAPAATGAVGAESDAALYDAYLRRMAAILRVGVEIPDECKEGYAGDPAAAAIVAAAQAAAAAASAANAAAEAAANAAAEAAVNDGAAPVAAAASGPQAPRPSTPTSLTAPEASTSTAAAAPAAGASSSSSPSPAAAPNLIAPAAAAAAAAARFPAFQRQQTRIVLGLLASESAAESRAPPNSASLVQLQRDVSTVLMGAAGADAAMLPLLEADGCRAFHALVQLLHRDLVHLAGPPAAAAAARREAPALLSPTLGALGRIVDASKTCRAHLKRCIFLELAPAPRTCADGRTPYRRADASNYAMGAAGSLSEKCVDPDPLALRQLLLSWIVTLDFNLKQAVSELLYRVCDDDSAEYIRLCGFGNAVGLLAEKGLPGFGMLRQKSVDVDAVIKSGKKL